ncbi:hypothetical protein ABZ490_29655 [Streptomyces sp. NPDC005811]|uniref:hypothetical protein n=1 Tax=Streptomyces sp. NPDC005811 TaxID=3154565 RepID=UPI0033C6C559
MCEPRPGAGAGDGPLNALGAATSLDLAYARFEGTEPNGAFSRVLDAVRFPGVEAAARARRERAVTVRARLAALAATEDRRQGDLHRLTRDGAEAAARAAALCHLAERDHADTHSAAAAQARDLAAHDREFAALLHLQDTASAE